MDKPSVIVSAFGSLHQAYHVTLACQERDLLKLLFTTYYNKNALITLIFKSLRLLGLKKMERRIRGRQLRALNGELVRNHLMIEALSYAFRVTNKEIDRYYYVNPLYDKIVSQKLTECDIFYGYEDGALFSIQKAKKFGAITILELRSLQPLYNEMNKEEAKILGLPIPNYLKSKKFDLVMERKFTEMKIADNLVVYTNRFKRYLMETHKIPEEKIIVQPLGADLELFYPQKREKKDGKFRILFVGQIVPRKGVHYLLEAVKQLDRNDIVLQIIGSLSPEMKPILKRYSRYFNYIGTIPHSQIVYYYNSADIFVLPSLVDSFGLVVYEAMACGLPVIITENCGAEIENGINGFVLPIRDIKALKERILLLYENKELREKMGRNAREYVNHFSWQSYREQIAQAMIEIYKGHRD